MKNNLHAQNPAARHGPSRRSFLKAASIAFGIGAMPAAVKASILLPEHPLSSSLTGDNLVAADLTFFDHKLQRFTLSAAKFSTHEEINQAIGQRLSSEKDIFSSPNIQYAAHRELSEYRNHAPRSLPRWNYLDLGVQRGFVLRFLDNDLPSDAKVLILSALRSDPDHLTMVVPIGDARIIDLCTEWAQLQTEIGHSALIVAV